MTLQLSSRQVERLVERLDLRAKLRLAQKLDRQTRRARWEPLVLKMRRRAGRRLTARQIRQLCEQVRQEQFQREQRPARRR
jgi:hypothetical protein